jgi:pyroglutamyl-peptidase
VALLLVCLAVLVSFGIHRYFVDSAQAQGQAPGHAGDRAGPDRPVILLTGFEPFGKGRPPNSSWEGIKSLDGKEHKGYQLVCKEMRVVWGSPLEQLQGWIAQYRPVAVFCFGQGAPGSFALESRASNERGQGNDNRGQPPPRPQIIENGPEQLQATLDCEKFARALSTRGYPVRVSTDAGRYLCEETLYTLEHLKSTQKLAATVAFCHVPPLGSSLGESKVTPEHVQQFVKEVLASWCSMQDSARDPRYPEVKEMVERYFRTWSDQDIKGYNDCFLPEACIQQLDLPSGRLMTFSRPVFIASQRQYHQTSPQRTIEVPETMDVRFEENLARVVVYWKLTAGPRTERGYDHFTLLKQEGNWRIINLVFYATTR